MVEEKSFERRPNPPGWVKPREGSNYNPYDPRDQRPPQGYPSEFKTPGKKSTWGTIPKDATQYQHMKETMQKLQYTPRPKSQLYPGQYKVLRRVNNYTRFEKGGSITAGLLATGITIYALFYYRWNDGYENVFSDFYRARLRFKYFLFGRLSPQEEDDLVPKHRAIVLRPPSMIGQTDNIPHRPDTVVESEYLMEKPSDRHVMEAQRILQDREETMMRALDNPEGNATQGEPKKKWFGIF